MEISVGARTSPLSQEQVQEVQKEIALYHPEIHFIPIWVTTEGDVDRSTPLWKVSKTDFFTREIDALVLHGKCRIAIHSAKDLPSPFPEGLCIIALTRGLDSRDSFVMRPGATAASLPQGAKVGTSSKRREAAIRNLRSDFRPVDIRGTIDERLNLLHNGVVEAIVVAEAALIRLQRTHENRIFLEHESEPLQGKLAIIGRADDQQAADLFAPLDTRKRVAIVGPSIPRQLSTDYSLHLSHCPFVQLAPLPTTADDLFPLINSCDTILTSKHAAQFLHTAILRFNPEHMRFFCVGPETAIAATTLFPGSTVLTASKHTQEGLFDLLLSHRPHHLFWPRSTHARDFLRHALQKAAIPCTELPLYTPVPHPSPQLPQQIETVYFTCPSAVDAFFARIPRSRWESLELKAIGVVTEARLQCVCEKA